MTKYTLTDEHRARFPEWRDKWIANALRTGPYTEADKTRCRAAMDGLYRAADLTPPPRGVFCASPISAAIASAIAHGVWWLRRNPARHPALFGRTLTEAEIVASAREAVAVACGVRRVPMAPYAATDAATYDATDDATDDATRAATGDATYAATDDATYAATRAATRAATYAATRDATDAATYAATDAATDAATRAATYAATRAATDAKKNWWVGARGAAAAVRHLTGIGGLKCATLAYRFYQGGSAWAFAAAYTAFGRDHAKLAERGLVKQELYDRYAPWETLAKLSGFRFMHEQFCIVSDRPLEYHVDERNRPHCETGPFVRWSDGSGFYAWHGARVPAGWIENRATLDPREVIAAENVEHRAAGAAIIGWPKMLSVLDAKVINDSGSDDIGTLIELTLPGLDEPGRFLKAKCPRNGIIVEGVPRVSDIDNLPIETALAAQAWRIGDPQSDYAHPPRRT